MSQHLNNSVALKETSDILLCAKAKYKSCDYLGAIVEYTLAIQFQPNIPLAFCCRGDAYYKLGEAEKAQLDYDRAIELDPNSSVSYYRRGNLSYSIQNYELAIADYTRAIELKPDFALAYSSRGFAYKELYGEREAVIDWRSAATLFNEQGNIEKYQYMMELSELSTSIETLTSGLLS